MGSKSLYAAYLLIGRAVSRPVHCLTCCVPALEPTGCWVGPGLAWLKNGGHQEGSHQWVLPRNSTAGVFIPAVSRIHPTCHTFTGHPAISAGRSGPGSHEVTAFSRVPGVPETLCASSKSGVSLCPGLWISCEQTLLAFKARCSGASPKTSPPHWGASCGAQNFYSCGRTFVI